MKFKKNIFFTLNVSLIIFSVLGCATTPKTASENRDNASGQISILIQQQWNTGAFDASSEYHFTLAQAYSSEGKSSLAIEEFKAALAYDPHSAILHAKLAAEYLKNGQANFAIDECKEAIKLDPQYTEVHLLLGGIYSLNESMDEALKEYDAVLKIVPTHEEAAIYKTQVLAEQGKVPESLRFIKSFAHQTKDSPAAWFYLGKLEQISENPAAALQAYRKALSLRPGFTQASLALGMILETSGENKKALEIYQSQMEFKQDLQIAGRLAGLYLKLSQYDLALGVLNLMSALDPDDLNVQMKIGLVYLQKENWAQSKHQFTEVLKKVPDSDKAHYYLGLAQRASGQWNEAIDSFKRVSVDSNVFEDANLQAAQIYAQLFQPEQSMKLLTESLKKSPENPLLYLMLASFYEDQNQLTQAADWLKKGLGYFPDHEKLSYFYGATLDRLGKTEQAVQQMEQLLKKNPQHPDALNFVAYVWTTQGVKLQEAEAMLKKAISLKPNNPFILDSMGWNLFALGRYSEALVYLEKAASLKADEPTILEHLVEVYTRNQMYERAQALRNKMLHMSSSRAPASVEPASVEPVAK